MAAFRFRAEGALAFRREREERARIGLASAEQRVIEAAAAVRAAEDGLALDYRRFADEERRASEVCAYVWHRAWIASLRQRLETLHSTLAAAEAQQRMAAAALQRARRDVRALEHLRERAWRDYRAGEARREQIDLDWLGTLKHTLAMRGAKEQM